MDCIPNGLRPDKRMICGLSDKGTRYLNEDAIAIEEVPDGLIAVLADGMGGHAAGEVAAAIAIATVREVIVHSYKPGISAPDIADILVDAFVTAHEVVISKAYDEKAGMGTTLVAAIIRGNELIAVNTGDSRIMLIRNGEIILESEDHTPVRTMYRMGMITEDEAMVHPYRHILNHAIGIDLKTDAYLFSLEKDDVLLLTSDGIHDYLGKEDILSCTRTGDAQGIATGIMEMALPVSEDNCSIIAYLHQ